MRKPIDKELAIALEEAIYPRRGGEWELKKYLRANGADVEDVSNNSAYWSKDIDLIADGVNIEVKWDGVMATTGNIYIETVSNMEKSKPGWFNICQADKLYYGDAKNKTFYVFDFPQLKEYVEQHKTEYKEKIAADTNKHSLGYIIPINTLTDLYTTISVAEYAM